MAAGVWPQTPPHVTLLGTSRLEEAALDEAEMTAPVHPNGDKPRQPVVTSLFPEEPDPETARRPSGMGTDYTKDMFLLLRNLETYVKDIHWVAEKSMLLSEKNMSTLDDIAQEQRRLVVDVHSKSNSKSGIPRIVSDLSAMDRIRGNVLDAAQSIEQRFRMPMRENSDVSELSKSLQQKTVEEHFQTIYANQESVQSLGKEHSEALESMMKKLDQLSILVPSQHRNPWPGSYRPADEDQFPANRALPTSWDNQLDCTGRIDEASQVILERAASIHEPERASCILREDLKAETQLDLAINTASRQSINTVTSTGTEVHGITSDFLRDEDDDSRTKKKPMLERLVSCGAFEIVFSLLIVLNTLDMCMQAEYRGWDKGVGLGIKGSHAATATADGVFEITGQVFQIAFTFEIVLKLLALRCRFFKSKWNIFDISIIGFAWFTRLSKLDLILNPMLLRLLRLVRLLRLLRGLNSLQAQFENLFLMVSGIKAAAPVLMWVIVLVFPLLASCALFMNYTLQDFMDSEDTPIEDVLKCYEYFGTFTKALLSMFEVTFGNWVPICRFTYSKIDAKFAFFFMTWKLVVGIAVLRIIYGVFLHVTFACASSDDASVINQRNREIKKYERKMKAFFRKFDQDGSGFLSKDRFLEVFANADVQTWLAGYLELEVHDVDLLYDLVDDLAGDNKVRIDQMVHGFLRLKGGARSIDALNVTRLIQDLLKKTDAILAQSLRSGSRDDNANYGFTDRDEFNRPSVSLTPRGAATPGLKLPLTPSLPLRHALTSYAGSALPETPISFDYAGPAGLVSLNGGGDGQAHNGRPAACNLPPPPVSLNCGEDPAAHKQLRGGDGLASLFGEGPAASNLPTMHCV